MEQNLLIGISWCQICLYYAAKAYRKARTKFSLYIMEDFVDFPKAYTQYKATGSKTCLQRCQQLAQKYQVLSSKLELGADVDTDLGPISDKYRSYFAENEQAPAEDTRQLLIGHYLTMEFKKLNTLLGSAFLYSNNMETLCWLYISQVYQQWFEDDELNLRKTTASNLKKIRNYKSKSQGKAADGRLAGLLKFVDIITYLNKFKTEFDIDGLMSSQLTFTVGELDEFNYATEYLVVHLLVLLCAKPFAQIELSEEYEEHLSRTAPNLIKMYHNIKVLDLSGSESVKSDLVLVEFLYEPNRFLNYIELVLKFKWFLNFISFTGRISESQLCDILATQDPSSDVEAFVFLISFLNLNRHGIGYDSHAKIFYNEDKRPDLEDLAYDIRKINHLISSQKHVLNLANELSKT